MVPALTAAWLVTRDTRYARHAALHLRAWFLDPATRMNPSLDYAQAIWGVTPGRGTGVIDTLHLVEVSRAARHLEKASVLAAPSPPACAIGLRNISIGCAHRRTARRKRRPGTTTAPAGWRRWPRSPPSLATRTRWRFAAERFSNNLLPDQLAPDGSFPLELARTKPYSYSLFDLDMLAIVCQIASIPASKVGDSTGRPVAVCAAQRQPLQEGRRIHVSLHSGQKQVALCARRGVLRRPAQPPAESALRRPGLSRAEIHRPLAHACLPDPKTAEIIRNFPVRQPVLWVHSV